MNYGLNDHFNLQPYGHDNKSTCICTAGDNVLQSGLRIKNTIYGMLIHVHVLIKEYYKYPKHRFIFWGTLKVSTMTGWLGLRSVDFNEWHN